MSLVHQPLVREEVEVPPRPALSKALKVRVWNREGGICWWCGKPVAHEGPTVEYDHKQDRDTFGAAADREENIFPMHSRPCHLEKSRGEDWPRQTKTRRQRALRLDTPREPSKRPIQSRGFDTTKTRGFDGVVRSRT